MTTPIEDYPERYPYVSILEDCIAYWDFRDGSLYDVVGNNKITLGTMTIVDDDQFNQKNSAIKATDGGGASLSSSISLQNEATIAFVAKDTNVVDQRYLLAVSGNSRIRHDNSGLTVLLHGYSKLYDLASIDKSQWNVYVILSSSSVRRLFVNGIEITGTETPSGYASAYVFPTLFTYNGQYGMAGVLSEIMFWNNLLSEAEVQQLTSLIQTRYIYPTQQVEIQE